MVRARGWLPRMLPKARPWCSRPCKAGGGRAAEVTSHPCASPHVSRRRWSASTSRAGSGTSCSSLATAPRRRPLASAGSKRHDDGRAGSGERGRRRRRMRNQGVAGRGCEMRWSCGVGGARRGRRASPVFCRARPGGQRALVKEGRSVYAQLDQNDHNAQNVRVITYGR